MAPKSLHPVQQKLLKLLADNINDPLSVRGLQSELDVSSPSVVTHHLGQLEKKGYLKRNPYNPKDYQVLSKSPESKIAYLNLYGLAVCGPKGSILEGDPIDRIPILSRLLSFPAADAFVVKAKGESMEPKIHEGDYVISRKVNRIENGKIYVCVNDGEVLIKQVRIDGKNKILQSFNEDFPPFNASQDFRVEGEVKATISRKF